MNDLERTGAADAPWRALDHKPGCALPAEFYTSAAVYARDLETILFRSWIYAGHVSQLPAVGSYFLVELGSESFIVVRSADDAIRAFANVCRHRGSRVCLESSGQVRAFVCPYHAWAYELDGRLRSRRAMPEGFDPAGYGLKTVRCEIFQGLVFISLDADVPDLATGLEPVAPAYAIYDLENARVAHQDTYTVDANWKLTIENFMECYHCAPAHVEYARCHTLKSPKDNDALRPAMLEAASELGYETGGYDNSMPRDGSVAYYYQRNALYDPNVTGSQDGRPVAPLLGSIPDFGGGVADVQIGPVSYGIFYPDHAVLYRFQPRDVQKTDMDIVWLVHKDAEEGRDYDRASLTWMWEVTTEADKTIILNNQRGVNSRYYEPGPLSEMEEFTARFIDWYLSEIY